MSVHGSANGFPGRPNTTPAISSIRVIKKRNAHHTLLTSSSRESTVPSDASCSLQLLDSGDHRFVPPVPLDEDDVIAVDALAMVTGGDTPTSKVGHSSQVVDRYASSVTDEVDAECVRQPSLTHSEAYEPETEPSPVHPREERRPQSAVPTIHESDRIASVPTTVSPPALPTQKHKVAPKQTPTAKKTLPTVRPVIVKQPARRPSTDQTAKVPPQRAKGKQAPPTETPPTEPATAKPSQPSASPQTAATLAVESSASKVMNVSISRRAVIGKGSFGVVYQAMDRNTNHIIACKEVCLVRSGSTADPVPLIRQELSLLKQLNHPHIVKCLGEDHDDKYLRIYMEYVTGGSIHSILRMFGVLQERQASNFTKQVLEGLKYLHDRNICHRDLKGDNLLVDTQGVLKLADFGTAKELLTQATSVAGTAYFMAPEVIQGVGHGVEADVWSVGCCVIEMLTGKPPFSHLKNQYAIMMHVAGGGVGNAIDEVLPADHSFSPEVVSFLKRCFPRKPAERATAVDLLTDAWILRPPNPSEGLDGERPFIDAGSIHMAGQQTMREAQTLTREEKERLPTATDQTNSVNPLALCDNDDDHVLGEW